MSASTPSRIGVVGYGAGGHRFHVPYIQAVEGWELAGVVTRSQERRAVLASEAPRRARVRLPRCAHRLRR